MAEVVRDGFLRLWGDSAISAPTVEDLIAAGESQTVEFKSTARWSLKASQVDKKLEHVIVKTVCALMNAEGGTLLIGVDDSGTALGLDHDWKTLGPKGNADGYELWLRQLLDTNLSVQIGGLVHIHFPEVTGEIICQVSVAAAGKPVFAKPAEGGQRASESGSGPATSRANTTATTKSTTGPSTGTEVVRRLLTATSSP